MSDRTFVTLTILASDYAAARPLMVGYTACGESKLTIYEEGNPTVVTSFEFEEINYGELPFLNSLILAGIPFDSNWGDGSEYGAGTTSCRFTAEGVAQVKELYDSDASIELVELMERIEHPELLKQYIQDRVKSREVLPWKDQAANQKLYRTTKLICPAE